MGVSRGLNYRYLRHLLLASLLNAVVAIEFDKADFEVHGLDQILDAFAAFEGDMYAGQIPTSQDPEKMEESKFMFWMFQPEAPSHPDTLTIWFNGGPGCSSFQGALFENSPVTSPQHPAGYFKSHADDPLAPNEWAWTKATNMMYLEIPQGTGFSTGPMPNSEFDISADVYGFLQNFYDTFPEFRGKELFLFGESYAGYYVPSVAHYIHQKNLEGTETEIALAGVGLGNGWVDAEVQGPAVIDYAFWHGLIDEPTKDSFFRVWEACKRGDPLPKPFHDFTIPDECNIMGAVMAAAGGEAFPPTSYIAPNPYDVTTFDLYPILFDDNSTYYTFYNNPEVKKALHAPEDITWLGCLPGAGRRRKLQQRRRMGSLPGKSLLAHDKPETMSPYMAELLEADIRVLIYNADRDLTTCVQGSERVLNAMDWKGASEWKSSGRALWMVDDKVSGYSKELEALTFLVVYNAGHLVPNNKPVESLELLRRFLSGDSFQDVALPSFLSPDLEGSSTTKASTIPSTLTAQQADLVPKPSSHAFRFFFTAALIVAAYGLGYWSAVRSASPRQAYNRVP